MAFAPCYPHRSTFRLTCPALFSIVREMVDNPTFYALINPVPGLPEAKQRELVAKFQPKEYYVVGKDGDLDLLHKLMRPGRLWVVAYAGLLAEPHGKKQDRVDSMIALKVAVHKRGGVVVEASGRRSDKSWPAMRKDGEEMCRRLSQGAKSALNAKKGTTPLTALYSDTDLRDMLRVKESKRYKNWRTRKAAMKKLGINPIPGRTWFIEKLDHVARSRNILESE